MPLQIPKSEELKPIPSENTSFIPRKKRNINRITEEQLQYQEYERQMQEQYIAQQVNAVNTQRQAEEERLAYRKSKKKKKGGTALGYVGKWFGASGGLLYGIYSMGGSTETGMSLLINIF